MNHREFIGHKLVALASGAFSTASWLMVKDVAGTIGTVAGAIAAVWALYDMIQKKREARRAARVENDLTGNEGKAATCMSLRTSNPADSSPPSPNL